MLSRDETSMIIFKSIDRMKEVSKMEQNNPWAVIGKLKKMPFAKNVIENLDFRSNK